MAHSNFLQKDKFQERVKITQVCIFKGEDGKQKTKCVETRKKSRQKPRTVRLRRRCAKVVLGLGLGTIVCKCYFKY